MTRIVCVSDTHCMHDQIDVPDGDILIHAGDSTIAGIHSEVSDFNCWLGKLPHKHKIVIAGNHDWFFERNPDLGAAALSNAIYLRDSSTCVEGLLIYGAPWQPRFCDWAFNIERGEPIRQKWDLIPERRDVLVTHGPPWGVLDRAHEGGEHLGCEELSAAVQRVKPRVHIFGHIHGGYGQQQHDATLYVNASICDEAYRPVNAPIVIDLEQGL